MDLEMNLKTIMFRLYTGVEWLRKYSSYGKFRLQNWKTTPKMCTQYDIFLKDIYLILTCKVESFYCTACMVNWCWSCIKHIFQSKTCIENCGWLWNNGNEWNYWHCTFWRILYFIGRRLSRISDGMDFSVNEVKNFIEISSAYRYMS